MGALIAALVGMGGEDLGTLLNASLLAFSHVAPQLLCRVYGSTAPFRRRVVATLVCSALFLLTEEDIVTLSPLATLWFRCVPNFLFWAIVVPFAGSFFQRASVFAHRFEDFCCVLCISTLAWTVLHFSFPDVHTHCISLLHTHCIALTVTLLVVDCLSIDRYQCLQQFHLCLTLLSQHPHMHAMLRSTWQLLTRFNGQTLTDLRPTSKPVDNEMIFDITLSPWTQICFESKILLVFVVYVRVVVVFLICVRTFRQGDPLTAILIVLCNTAFLLPSRVPFDKVQLLRKIFLKSRTESKLDPSILSQLWASADNGTSIFCISRRRFMWLENFIYQPFRRRVPSILVRRMNELSNDRPLFHTILKWQDATQDIMRADEITVTEMFLIYQRCVERDDVADALEILHHPVICNLVQAAVAALRMILRTRMRKTTNVLEPLLESTERLECCFYTVSIFATCLSIVTNDANARFSPSIENGASYPAATHPISAWIVCLIEEYFHLDYESLFEIVQWEEAPKGKLCVPPQVFEEAQPQLGADIDGIREDRRARPEIVRVMTGLDSVTSSRLVACRSGLAIAASFLVLCNKTAKISPEHLPRLMWILLRRTLRDLLTPPQSTGFFRLVEALFFRIENEFGASRLRDLLWRKPAPNMNFSDMAQFKFAAPPQLYQMALIQSGLAAEASTASEIGLLLCSMLYQTTDCTHVVHFLISYDIELFVPRADCGSLLSISLQFIEDAESTLGDLDNTETARRGQLCFGNTQLFQRHKKTLFAQYTALKTVRDLVPLIAVEELRRAYQSQGSACRVILMVLTERAPFRDIAQQITAWFVHAFPSPTGVTFTTETQDSGDGECSVCLKALEGSVCRVDKCGHGFHRQCAFLWFMSKDHCPLCRTPLN